MFGNDAQKARWLVPLAKGEKLGAWALTEPEAGSDAAGTRTDGDARRRLLGAERHQDVHHARRERRRDGGDGLDRSQPRRQGHLGVRRRARDAGVQRRTQGRQAGHARQRDHRGALRAVRGPVGPHAWRGRAGLHPGAAGAGRRPHRHRRAVGRPGAGRLRRGSPLRARDDGSSVSRSRRFRRFSGSWPTWRRESRRRVCSRIAPRT